MTIFPDEKALRKSRVARVSHSARQGGTSISEQAAMCETGIGAIRESESRGFEALLFGYLFGPGDIQLSGPLEIGNLARLKGVQTFAPLLSNFSSPGGLPKPWRGTVGRP